mmetsp:Transcript_14549/g.36556  ORF Transcript_14549/g.36556 Transcript_14549/m.36556 type:complete len:281 (-) Transcript_14549:1309-2151(-)
MCRFSILLLHNPAMSLMVVLSSMASTRAWAPSFPMWLSLSSNNNSEVFTVRHMPMAIAPRSPMRLNPKLTFSRALWLLRLKPRKSASTHSSVMRFADRSSSFSVLFFDKNPWIPEDRPGMPMDLCEYCVILGWSSSSSRNKLHDRSIETILVWGFRLSASKMATPPLVSMLFRDKSKSCSSQDIDSKYRHKHWIPLSPISLSPRFSDCSRILACRMDLLSLLWSFVTIELSLLLVVLLLLLLKLLLIRLLAVNKASYKACPRIPMRPSSIPQLFSTSVFK